ncbi:MAG: metal-dependent hydrolase [Gallionellales bacterium RIFOXYB12_FULL_54_9]|nr:MAG: metal-dependent hydrolase [Gallionellales bacterium RIFOXYB12_FULL_54_9]
MQDNKALNEWVIRLSESELPVLKQTARELAALREDDNKLSAHSIANVIKRDPVMTVKLLRYLQLHKRRAQTTDVVQVEQALLMLGMESFFSHVVPKLLIEDVFKPHIVALPPILRVIHRSHRASEYAYDWALRLHDMHFEEVRITALLHDIAEILMWCFAPDDMLKIRDMQKNDKTLRSRTAQEQVLGFSLLALQKSLNIHWALPELLQTSLDESCALQQRVRNVTLAINLARHSANGWDDAALPDDYRDIGVLLHIPTEQAMLMVTAEAGMACDLSKPH